jgi:GTP pyrophosphokinase
MRTEAMHVVAESGVAAHWLYKARGGGEENDVGLGTQWLQSLLDIQQETHDSKEFWDHVKIDLFPDAVYVFTPRNEIMSLPRGATVLDFAYEIHSDVGDRSVSGRVNGVDVPLRHELRNGDVVEVVTSEAAQPHPSWLSVVRTGRARSKIRHYLKTQSHTDAVQLGERMLGQALRAEGIARLPGYADHEKTAWDKLLRFSGHSTAPDLFADIAWGRRIASIVAKRLAAQLIESGVRPDPVLISTERFAQTDDHELQQSSEALMLDGAEGGSVMYANCCHPVPGDAIVGYLGRGEGLTVHRRECLVATKAQSKDQERFVTVQWADEISRPFRAAVRVTVKDGTGVLARIASAIATEEADIVHVDMGSEAQAHGADLGFLLQVRDKDHLDQTLRALRRAPAVIRAERH